MINPSRANLLRKNAKPALLSEEHKAAPGGAKVLALFLSNAGVVPFPKPKPTPGTAKQAAHINAQEPS